MADARAAQIQRERRNWYAAAVLLPGWNSSRPHLGICGTDHGALYAAKDMMDPVHGRRIYWGWNAYVAPAQGGLSLPRELTWHPELQQLVQLRRPRRLQIPVN